MNERTFRLVTSALLALMVALALWAFSVAVTIPGQLNNVQLQVSCASARANIEQLEALRRVTRSLGLPPETVVVPEVPEECI